MEQIYTIVINEAFEKCAEEEAKCPFCAIKEKFEKDEIDLILGASMMEPAVRIRTNKLGFCRDHSEMMLRAGKKLSVALLLESHMAEVSELMKISKIMPAKSAKGSADSIAETSKTCYVCERIGSNFKQVLSNAVYMWSSDAEFRKLFSKQKCFCLPHYAEILKTASAELRKNDFASFVNAIRQTEDIYISKVRGNLSSFIRKFDYRYADEPMGEEVKDAVEKAVAVLCGVSGS